MKQRYEITWHDEFNSRLTYRDGRGLCACVLFMNELTKDRDTVARYLRQCRAQIALHRRLKAQGKA